MNPRHKVFISYHHANDQAYKDRFIRLFDGNYMVDGSVGDDEIDDSLSTETIRTKIRDEYLRDTSVTVVLIGSETWKRKHVDWEISSSLRDTTYNPRSGLLGILLPTYPLYSKNEYNPRTIPPRLCDNIQSGYAKIYNWSESALSISGWIHEAYERKRYINPVNSRIMFGKNRSGDYWTD